MTAEADDDIEREDRRICPNCVGEPFLSNEIEQHG